MDYYQYKIKKELIHYYDYHHNNNNYSIYKIEYELQIGGFIIK